LWAGATCFVVRGEKDAATRVRARVASGVSTQSCMHEWRAVSSTWGGGGQRFHPCASNTTSLRGSTAYIQWPDSPPRLPFLALDDPRGLHVGKTQPLTCSAWGGGGQCTIPCASDSTSLRGDAAMSAFMATMQGASVASTRRDTCVWVTWEEWGEGRFVASAHNCVWVMRVGDALRPRCQRAQGASVASTRRDTCVCVGDVGGGMLT